MEPALKWRRGWWTIPAIALSAAIAGGALYVWYAASILGGCKIDVRRSIPSPDGKKSLVVFGKECGTTVGFNTQISIAPADRPFSAETYPAFHVTSGLHVVTASWLGDSAVEIAINPGGDETFRHEQDVGDVKVLYK